MTIGTITVDLLARTGSFETDMDRSAKLAAKRAKEIDAAVSKAGAAIGVALGAAAVGAAAAFSKITEGIAKYQELSEKTGETASNIASLQTASDLSGVALDTVAGASVRLTSALSKTDDESKLVGKGIEALGLNFDEFKKLSPAEQLDAVAKAMSGFADGSEKTAAAVAIFGKAGAELIPFLNDLADQGGRQIKLTDEQIRLADEHSKAQARTKSQINQLAQAIVANSLPAITDMTAAIKDAIEQVTGMGGASDDLKRNSSIQAFAEDGARFLATLVDYAVKVGEAFKGVGKTIGGVAAIQMALVKGQPKDAFNIGKELLSDSKDFFSAPSLADALDKRIADRRRNDQQRALETRGFNPGLNKIDASKLSMDRSPKGGKKDNSAAQEAKAQLAQDLEDMKKNTALLATAFDNDEKILQAKRSANLISDAEYYQKKRDIIIATGEVEDAGLQASIDRLKKEQATLSGKDAIDNRRKLNDAEAELRKSRAATAAQLETNNIEATASTKRLTTAMDDARAAAESLLDATNRARALELASMGQGTKQRDYSAAISQIEQTYEQKRQDLERDRRNGKFKDREDDYRKELDLIAEFQKKAIDSYISSYAVMDAKQRDFLLGASEGAKNYADEARNAYKQTEDAVKNMFGGLEDALTSFVTTGKADVKSLVNSIISDFARITIRQQITGPLADILSKSLGGGDSLDKLLSSNNAFGTGTSGGSSFFSDLGASVGKFFSGLGFADGGSPPVGVASLVGERGPELFVPNTAGKIIPNHLLGGGGPPVSVVINNTVGDVATVGMLKQAQQGTEARIAQAIGRSQRYGGQLSV